MVEPALFCSLRNQLDQFAIPGAEIWIKIDLPFIVVERSSQKEEFSDVCS